jgi:hypothetical protein
MSATLLDSTLGPAVIGHLDAQLVSARRLLDLVLRQGQAIRRQDVEAVVARLGELQAEMERRGRLEADRTQLLTQAGGALGMPAHAITLEALTSLMRPADAAAVQERSAELRGLLAEVGREHTVNRALMRQELAFLDHLTRLLGAGNDQPSYGPPAEQRATVEPRAAALRVLDLRA